MPFSRPTLQTIIDRIEADIVSRLIGQVALLRNALLTILARVFAGAIHTCYGYLDYISLNLLPDLAERYWLERHGTQWSIARLPATFSVGDVIFTGTPTTEVPAGTIVVREDGWEYTTTLGGFIGGGGSLSLPVEATTAGVNGNTASGIVLTIASPIASIDDDVTVNVLDSGADEETDDAYRARIIFRIQNTPAGGAEHDYVTLGRTVSGVANIFVFGNYNGIVPELGYVTVVVLGVSPQVPGAGILTDVENTLAPIVPVTATLVVDPIVEAELDFAISITPNTSDLQTAITASITEMLEVEGAPGEDVLLSRIRNAISTAGPDDYDITGIDVDGGGVPIDDIVLNDHQYPILDAIVYSTL